MELWQLYLIFTLPNLKSLLIILAVLGACAFVPFCVEYFAEKTQGARRWTKVLAIVVALASTAATFIPSQSQMMYIVSGYYGTNIEDIEKLPPAIVRRLNSWLENKE